MQILSTPKSRLSQLSHQDHLALHQLFSDPQVMQFSRRGPETSSSYTQSFLKYQLKAYQTEGYGLWRLNCLETHSFQGICGLITQWIDGVPEVELAYRLLPEWWGQGIGTTSATAVRDFAFEHLRLFRLISIIEPENIGSIRVAEKNGMIHEKTIMYHQKPAYVFSVYRTSDRYR